MGNINQREFERVKSNTALTLILDGGHREQAGICRDLSEGGIGILTDRPLSLGTECYVKMHDGRTSASKYQALIEVRRVSAIEVDGKEMFVIGAAILERF